MNRRREERVRRKQWLCPLKGVLLPEAPRKDTYRGDSKGWILRSVRGPCCVWGGLSWKSEVGLHRGGGHVSGTAGSHTPRDSSPQVKEPGGQPAALRREAPTADLDLWWCGVRALGCSAGGQQAGGPEEVEASLGRWWRLEETEHVASSALPHI